MGSRLCAVMVALVHVFAQAPAANAGTAFVEFESGPVRPLALSPDGAHLYVVNIPDNRLEVFRVTETGLSPVGSVAVGMEPVSVALRNDGEAWVVNHLSDSVSIVDLTRSPAAVVRTLLVGDEPRDIVFAGAEGDRAFISTAHRGQHRVHSSLRAVPGAGDPQLATEGIGRADVWVFDATALGTTLGGTPVEILTFFADTPRGLAASSDGNTVYAAAFHSGNQTTVISETVVPDGFGLGGVPGPRTNHAGVPAPEVGLIVKKNAAGQWLDSTGVDWSAAVHFDLPDHDVFAINANTLSADSRRAFDHVGTVLFNLVVNPVSGRVYVTNQENPNNVEFEGDGEFGRSTVQGRVSEARISVLDPTDQSVDVQHVNQHVDYDVLEHHAGFDASGKDHSLATLLQPVVSSDGALLYVAAFGSSKIGVFETAEIEAADFETRFVPAARSSRYIDTLGGGPSGLALDERNNRLYVLTRFNNAVEVIDLALARTTEQHSLHNPEPVSVVTGRPMLYDAFNTSANGEASCASCHVFADFDSLAWNLGDPGNDVSRNTQPAVLFPEPDFHPMKGPMTTQTLRGLATHGAMHWRGDRVDGSEGLDACLAPVGSPCDEGLSFRNFRPAFEGLIGRDGPVTATEMQQFADFILDVFLPPNPVRSLDNRLSPTEQRGEALFFGPVTDTIHTCNGCHTLDPSVGLFGTNTFQTFENETMNFKVAHLRNQYQKVGMFGSSTTTAHTGEQVRGFGVLHDGSVDTVNSFLGAAVFNLNEKARLDSEAFALAFETDLAPIVGQQITLSGAGSAAVHGRIDLLIQRSAAAFSSLMLGGAVTECDLIAKGSVGGEAWGWVRETGGRFRSDRDSRVTDTALRALAVSEGPITYTCVPPGSGVRAGIDRDLDGALDGIDNCPAVANPKQADVDADGIGDLCENGSVDIYLASTPTPTVLERELDDMEGGAPPDAADPAGGRGQLGMPRIVLVLLGLFTLAAVTGIARSRRNR